ncbi:MAG: ABC transporter substrate-binding protein [Candidatus Lustribacter sp.]|jgi:NitT/TauT family transport system substrate-binding protein
MNRSRLIQGAAAATFVPFVTPGRARAALTTLTVGSAQTDSASELFSGIHEGFFSRGGLDIQPQNFSNGNATFAAMLGGSLDIADSNTLSIAVAFAHGAPLRMISTGAVYTSKDPTTVMVVAPDSKLRTARDLSGTTVGVNVLAGIAHIATQAWIDKNGGDSKQVHFLELPNTAMTAALTSKRIDAGILPEPFYSQSKSDTRFFSNAFDGIGPRWMIDGFVATQTWIAANRDVAHRFAQIKLQSAAWANRHQDQTAELVAKGMNLDVSVVRKMARATFLEKVDLTTIQPVIDAGAQYGAIPARFEATDLFSPDFLH